MEYPSLHSEPPPRAMPEIFADALYKFDRWAAPSPLKVAEILWGNLKFACEVLLRKLVTSTDGKQHFAKAHLPAGAGFGGGGHGFRQWNVE